MGRVSWWDPLLSQEQRVRARRRPAAGVELLEGLFVAIENLEIGHRRRGLRGWPDGAVEANIAAAAGDQCECQGTGHGGTEVAASVEHHAGVETLQEAHAWISLLFPQADTKLLVEVGRSAGHLPGVECGKRVLERSVLVGTGRAGPSCAPTADGRPGAGGENQVGQFGLESLAVHVVSLLCCGCAVTSCILSKFRRDL